MNESGNTGDGASDDLRGMGVLVTRPTGQAETLGRLIESAGGQALPFPTVEIRPAVDLEGARALLAEPWYLMVFTSRNAVEYALALGFDGRWTQAERLAAVGKATGVALSEAGRAPDLVPPERFDSESLVALPGLADMAGRRVLIARGEGGRALLGEVLTERGADVRFAEVYRRVRPAVDPGPLIARWSEDVDLVVATSDEVLLNLLQMLGDAGRAALLATPLVVISERTGQTARGLGFRTLRVAERAEDVAIVRALTELATGTRSCPGSPRAYTDERGPEG